MRNLLLVLALSLPFVGHSQEFSVGARTGVGKNFFLRTQDQQMPCNTTWDKQVFTRYQSKKRFALEIGAEHYAYTSNATRTILFADHIDPNTTISTTRTQNIAVYVSAQYDIMCRGAKTACPIFKNMRSYVGVVLAAQSSEDRTASQVRILATGATSDYNATNQYTTIMTGLNHTLTYKFSEHLSFSSVLSYKFDISGALSSAAFVTHNAFENHIGYQIGAGYTF